MRTLENIARIQEVLTRNPRRPVKRLSQHLDLKQSSTLLNVRQDLKMFHNRSNNPSPMLTKKREPPFVDHFSRIWTTTHLNQQK